MKKLYVGNLPFSTTEDEVRDMFAEHGTINSVAWITDYDTGRFRGFCFVEMDESSATTAMKELDGKEVGGRALRVNEARPREKRDNRRDNRGRGNRGSRWDW
jgi:cold-inducible RNA-binding protein